MPLRAHGPRGLVAGPRTWPDSGGSSRYSYGVQQPTGPDPPEVAHAQLPDLVGRLTKPLCVVLGVKGPQVQILSARQRRGFRRSETSEDPFFVSNDVTGIEHAACRPLDSAGNERCPY